MKKVNSFLLILFCSLILIGCHKHNYKTEVTNPTCIEQGYTTYTCKCGNTYVDNYVKELGHNYSDWNVVTEATENTKGLKEKVCSRCNDKVEETIPELSHTHIYTEKVIEATCEEQGYILHTCSCGDSYKDNEVNALGHNEEIIKGYEATCVLPGLTEGKRCSVCKKELVKQTEIKALNHKYSDWETVTEATETESGLREKKCDYCGDIVSEIIPMLNHTHKLVHYDKKEPTCVETGYEAYDVCQTCSYSTYHEIEELGHITGELVFDEEDYCLDNQIGNIYCKRCNELISSFGHNYKVETLSPTCTNDGYTKYICSVCNKTISLTLEKIDHIETSKQLVTEATCTKEGEEATYCLLCNNKVSIFTIDKQQHNYKSEIKDNYLIYTCTQCGDIKKEVINNTYKLEFETNGGNSISPISIQTSSTIDLPSPTKQGYTFIGWYLDEDFNIKFNLDDITNDTKLYAMWSPEKVYSESNTNNIITDVDLDFEFIIESSLNITLSNVKAYIKIKDLNDNEVSFNVKSKGNNKYAIYSDNYEEGMTYSVTVEKEINLIDIEGNEFWFITKSSEHYNVKFNPSTILINTTKVYGMMDQDDKIYLFLYEDLLNPDDCAIIYEDDIYNILYIFTVLSEGTFENKYVYEIIEVDSDLVFDECDVFYKTDVELNQIEFDEDLIENATEEFENSQMYRTLLRATKKVQGQIGNYYYDLNEFKLEKPKFSVKDKSLIFEFKIYIQYARMHVDTRKVESVVEFNFNVTSNLSWSIDVNFKSHKNFSFALNTKYSFDTALVLFTNPKKEGTKEIKYFKNLLEEEIEKSSHEEIDNGQLNKNKSVTIGKLSFGTLGTNIKISLKGQFSFSFIGKIGAEVHMEINTKAGIKRTKSKFDKILSVDTYGYAQAYLMGKVETSIGLSAKVEVNLLGIVNAYVNASVDPYLNFGGILSAHLTVGSKINTSGGGYLELGVKTKIEAGASAKIKILWKTKTIFNEKWTLVNKDYKIISLGDKKLYLFYNENNETYNKTIKCGEEIDLNKIVNLQATVQNIATMSKNKEKVNSSYLLVAKEKGVTLSTDGIIKISNNDKDTYQLKVKVSSNNNIYKYIYINITINHIESDWNTKIDATCSTNGEKYTDCIKCHKVLNEETINALGHKYKDEEFTPTCTEQGYTLYTCTRCNDSYKDNYVNALGHIEEVINGYEATCTEKGLTNGKRCARCNIILVNQEEIKELGHDYSDWEVVKESTEEEKGLKEKVCSRCSDKQTEEIPMLIHTHSYTETVIAPTCVDEGYTIYICKCGDSYEDDYVDAIGHIEEVINGYEATCTEKGLTEGKKCSVCEKELVKQTEIEELGHEYGEWSVTKEATETEKGLKEKVCSRCNDKIEETISMLTHTHNYTEEVTAPTCVDKGYTTYTCSCGDSYQGNEVEALGHKEEAVAGKEATCTEDGLTQGKKCSVCDKVLATQEVIKAGHKEEIIKGYEATCTEKGLTEGKKCSVCGEVLVKQEEIKANGHSESSWIIDTDATCTEKGSKYKECTMCKKILETEEIGLKEHSYVNGECSMCGKQNSSANEIVIDNGYIYFGEYPQTLKEESVTVSTTPDSDGYYLGSDGERYAEVEAKPWDSSYVFNDKTTSIVKGNTYYFKVEPIKWKIEEESNGTYKLISTIILDAQKYYSSLNDRTIDGQIIYANNYEYSDIRKWLNNDFLNKAFTEQQQVYINTTKVDNSLTSTGDSSNKYICNNTLDKIYLPSVEEMTNTSYGYDGNSSRRKQLTDYAKALGCYMYTSSSYYNNGRYWLRSPIYYDSYYVRLVNIGGNVNYCSVDSTYVGVAPALSITIK